MMGMRAQFAKPTVPVSFIPTTGLETTLLRGGRGTGSTIVVVPDDEAVVMALPWSDQRRAYCLSITHIQGKSAACLVPVMAGGRPLEDRGASVGLGLLAVELARLGVPVHSDTIPVLEEAPF